MIFTLILSNNSLFPLINLILHYFRSEKTLILNYVLVINIMLKIPLSVLIIAFNDFNFIVVIYSFFMIFLINFFTFYLICLIYLTYYIYLIVLIYWTLDLYSKCFKFINFLDFKCSKCFLRKILDQFEYDNLDIFIFYFKIIYIFLVVVHDCWRF